MAINVNAGIFNTPAILLIKKWQSPFSRPPTASIVQEQRPKKMLSTVHKMKKFWCIKKYFLFKKHIYKIIINKLFSF